MRGSDVVSGSMFSYVDLEDRIPAKHPLRLIREIVNEVLLALDADFSAMYADWTSPDLVESQLLFLLAGAERRFERGRADIAEAGVPPAGVIEPFDILANGLAGLVARREGRAPDQL